MASLLRAIVVAVRSWLRTMRGRRASLNAPADRAEEENRESVASQAEVRRQAEDVARLAAEAEGRQKADEEARAQVAAEAEERRQAEEARLAEEAETRRQSEEAARAAAEARRKAEEDERARLATEAEARRRAEETARAAAEAEARRKAEEDERARLATEAEARRWAEEAARAAAEAEARRKAEEDERTRLAAEAEARRQAEEAARAAAEVDVRRKAEKEERVAGEDEGRGHSEADAGAWLQAGAGRPPAAEEVKPANGEGSTEEGTDPTARRAPRTRAPRYRGPAGGSPAPRQAPSTARTAAARTEPVAAGNRVLPVELRVRFERDGSLRVTLLPRRVSGLPDELTVQGPSGAVDLFALQEDWYQDIAPQNLGALLCEGVLWRDESTGQEWLLSGREIFVLTSGTAHSGLVSCPRLVLGRKHAILCTTSSLAAVEAVLREAGCDAWTTLDENDGAPRGWVFLRDVWQRRPLPWTDNSDILNALRPLPQVEIALEGGICLGYSSWLAEHPPSIRVYGDPDHTGAVQIDRQNATASDDGRYTAPGWDSVGPHQVWCKGATKSYTLVRREPPSQSWAAFSFPAPGARGGRIAICGPLVRAFTDSQADGEEAATSEIIQIAPANPVLLGSVPGQVVVTYPRPDVRGAQCLVASPFAPVWAIPAQPLHCDKRENRVRLVGEPFPPGEGSGEVKARISRLSIEQWCSAIQDAGRKGLAVEPADPAVVELWRRYRRYARDLWRRLR